jgi:hypothetical protein
MICDECGGVMPRPDAADTSVRIEASSKDTTVTLTPLPPECRLKRGLADKKRCAAVLTERAAFAERQGGGLNFEQIALEGLEKAVSGLTALVRKLSVNGHTGLERFEFHDIEDALSDARAALAVMRQPKAGG